MYSGSENRFSDPSSVLDDFEFNFSDDDHVTETKIDYIDCGTDDEEVTSPKTGGLYNKVTRNIPTFGLFGSGEKEVPFAASIAFQTDDIYVCDQNTLLDTLKTYAYECLHSDFKNAPAAPPLCGGAMSYISRSEESSFDYRKEPSVLDNETYGRPLYNKLTAIQQTKDAAQENKTVKQYQFLDEAVAVIVKHLSYKPYYGNNPSITVPKDQDYVPYK